MEDEQISNIPNQCPVCGSDVVVTRLECTSCGTEVNGVFRLSHLASVREPHASVLEMFLRVRGNVKEMERELGLSYPTVRARLEEALEAAGYPREAKVTEGGESGASWEARFEADLSERIRARVEDHLAGIIRGRDRHERHRVDHERERQAHERERLAHERERERHAAEVERMQAERRKQILEQLERGEIESEVAVTMLRELKVRR